MEAKPIEVIMRIDFGTSECTPIIAYAEKVQELVRCKDCSHWQYDWLINKGWCEGRRREHDDFCSRAVRKEVEDESNL